MVASTLAFRSEVVKDSDTVSVCGVRFRVSAARRGVWERGGGEKKEAMV